MKYDQTGAVKEILRRREKLRLAQLKKTIRRLYAASIVLTAILAAGMAGIASESRAGMSVYGAFLLPGEAGGYVLMGGLAFALGVVITLLCIQRTKLRMQRRSEEITEETEEKR